MSLKSAWQLTKATFSEWSEDNVSRLSAALAYYTMFAIAPLLIIAIAIAGFVWGGRAQASHEANQQVSSLMGPEVARMVQTMVARAGRHRAGIVATIISIVILIIGATGVFAELQGSLNTIWGVRTKSRGVWGVLHTRFLSFAMVLGITSLLLASLVISAVISGMAGLLGSGGVAQIVNLAASLAVFTLLFAMILKVLPDVRIRWTDVWIGALATAILFTIGKYLIGLYLGRGSVSSVFGAAGSLVAILVWVYYSAQILFLGAEFTQVYARWSGTRIRPTENAEPTAAARAADTEEAKPAAVAPGPGGGECAVEVHHPSVPAGRELAAPRADGGGASRLVPLVIGFAVGRLIMPAKKLPAGKPTRHFAATRILEPGWTSRRKRAGRSSLIRKVARKGSAVLAEVGEGAE